MNKETCASRIKLALELRNMKQSELCKKTGIPKSAVSQYISGSFEPKQDRIHLIAKALGVSEAWLMGYDVPIEKISDVFKIRRAEIGLSRSQLAKMAEVSPSIIHRIEQGDVASTQTEKLLRVAHILDIQPSCIFEQDESSPPKEDPFLLTQKEEAVVKAYRAHPEMQSAVDTLLGIQNNAAPQPAPQKLYEGRVAAFGAGPETLRYTEKQTVQADKVEDLLLKLSEDENL